MRALNGFLVFLGAQLLFLCVGLPVMTGNAMAQSKQERFGPGRVNCLDQTCTLVGFTSLGTGTFIEFAHSLLPEGKREEFLHECFNGECVATLIGARIEPRSFMVTPNDIEWHKVP